MEETSMSSRLKQFLAVVFTLFSFIAGSAFVHAQTHGGTLRLGMFQAPRHLNSGVQSGMATAIPASQLFASLLRYDDEWNPQPYLATEWEWSDDGKTFTATLRDRKSTRLNSSHVAISYAVFCLKKKKNRIEFSVQQQLIRYIYHV